MTDLPHYTGTEWLEGMEWGIDPVECAENYGFDSTSTDSDLLEIAAEQIYLAGGYAVIDGKSLFAALKDVRAKL